MIDLSPPHLAIVERILAEHVPECEVRAFGSRATWNAKDYSDLDLAIIGAEVLPRGTVARLKEAFEESRLPMRVDVVDWHAIADGFRLAIESDCVLVQEGTLPRVKDEWREMSLGEAVELKRGYDLPKRDRSPGPVPLVSSSGITDHHGEAKVKGPGVVTGRYGTLGQVFFVRDDFWPLNTTLYVRDFKGNDPRFISYFLRTLDFSAYSDKAAVPGLNRNHLHQEIVRVPPLEDQRAIARVLGALDDKIELNRRMSETLEEMARALFRSWFVDFDPVRAKAEGRPSGLPPDLDALFPASFEASELGEIPAGWEVKTLGDLVAHLRDSRNPLETPDEVFSHYSIPAYDAGRTPRRERGGTIKSVKTLVRPGVVLVSKLNPDIERVWVPDVAPDEQAISSTEFLVLQPRAPFREGYIYCLARSPSFRSTLQSLVTGTSKSHQRARVGAILGLDILAPPTAVVEAFEAIASAMLSRTLDCRSESLDLAEIRDALLPELVSGEVRVGATLTVEE